MKIVFWQKAKIIYKIRHYRSYFAEKPLRLTNFSQKSFVVSYYLLI